MVFAGKVWGTPFSANCDRAINSIQIQSLWVIVCFTYPRLDILVWCTYERVHTWVGMVFSLTKAAGQVLVAITIGDWSFETVLGTLSVYGPNTVG